MHEVEPKRAEESPWGLILRPWRLIAVARSNSTRKLAACAVPCVVFVVFVMLHSYDSATSDTYTSKYGDHFLSLCDPRRILRSLLISAVLAMVCGAPILWSTCFAVWHISFSRRTLLVCLSTVPIVLPVMLWSLLTLFVGFRDVVTDAKPMWLSELATHWRNLAGWGLLVMYLWVGINAIVLARRIGRRGGTDCGACGYDIRGLVGGVCPECGSKLGEQTTTGRLL